METTESERKKELPLDVIREILHRLPVKSLLRFKCVCKNWYAIIISPRFIDIHYATSKHNKHISFYYHSNHYPSPNDVTFSFRILDVPVGLTIPGYTDSHLWIVGCSKGVVCLSLTSIIGEKDDFALWNPATMEFNRIGPVDDRSLYERSSAGFCFDPVKNTFKVLATSVYFGVGGISARVGTFMSNSYSWSVKTFDNRHMSFPDCDMLYYEACSNKCMYWTIGYRNGRRMNSKYILYFDMVDEVFENVMSPCPTSTHARLEGYRDTVAMIARSDYNSSVDGFSFDVWVLIKDDSGGGSISWSKQLTCRPQGYYIRHPLGFFGNADEVNLVVLKGFNYCLCNMKTGAVTELAPQSYSKFIHYSESLASVN